MLSFSTTLSWSAIRFSSESFNKIGSSDFLVDFLDSNRLIVGQNL